MEAINTLEYNYFLSAADSNLRENYLIGLRNALKKFSVESVLTTVEKKHYEDTYMIVAHDHSGVNLGGIRIEVKTPQNLLPIEKGGIPYKRAFELKINNMIRQNQTVAELCGMWVNHKAKEAAGYGPIGPQLCLEATELALDMGIDVLTGIMPIHTVDYMLRLGYITDPDIPQMAYPDDRYLSSIIWYYNPRPQKIKYVENQFNLDV